MADKSILCNRHAAKTAPQNASYIMAHPCLFAPHPIPKSKTAVVPPGNLSVQLRRF